VVLLKLLRWRSKEIRYGDIDPAMITFGRRTTPWSVSWLSLRLRTRVFWRIGVGRYARL